jgi:hypothetical protein
MKAFIAILTQPQSDTLFIVVEAVAGLGWLVSVTVCLLKGKIWSAIIGILSAAGQVANWTVGGWYILNIFVWVPLFAALRIGRPDFLWAKWFYGPRKMAKAQERFP